VIQVSDDRQKAQDVFNETDFLFGKKVGFAEAFPMIEEIKIEVKEEGEGVYEGNEVSIYSSKSILPGEYINCRNSLCYNGGFRIGSIIRAMVRERKTDLETSEICQGYEGSPKGKKRYGKCFNMFDVKVHIKYKQNNENQGTPT
jgi:hypothetical protein